MSRCQGGGLPPGANTSCGSCWRASEPRQGVPGHAVRGIERAAVGVGGGEPRHCGLDLWVPPQPAGGPAHRDGLRAGAKNGRCVEAGARGGTDRSASPQPRAVRCRLCPTKHQISLYPDSMALNCLSNHKQLSGLLKCFATFPQPVQKIGRKMSGE